MELQFNSKWIGSIWHTQRKKPKPQNRRTFWQFQCCLFTALSGKGPEPLSQRQSEFWPIKHVDASCAAQWSLGRNSSASEPVWRGGQELGTPGLVPPCFTVPLAVLFPSASPRLKKLALWDRWLYLNRGSFLSCVFFTNKASNSLWHRKVRKYTATKLFGISHFKIYMSCYTFLENWKDTYCQSLFSWFSWLTLQIKKGVNNFSNTSWIQFSI